MPLACPTCDAPLPRRRLGATLTCASCQTRLQIVDLPDRPCSHCGAPVPLPQQEATQCTGCNTWHATDPDKTVRVRTRCPRCNRAWEVPPGTQKMVCKACQAPFGVGRPRKQP